MSRGVSVPLSELARRLVDAPTFVIVATLNPDGGPQSSVVWIKRDGDDLIFSTVRGRQKARNLARDPRISVCFFDPTSPGNYVEVRGTVALSEAGGRELIDELSWKYTGHGYPQEPTGTVRLVCRVTATQVHSR